MALFEEAIKSEYTKKNYISNLKHFMKFAEINSVDQLLIIQKSQLQQMLEDYLIDLKRNMNPNSIPSKFHGIKHFCIMNKIDLNWEIIHKMFPQKQRTQNFRSYTTKEIKTIISNTNSLRDKAFIYFLTSTGARIGVFDNELLIGHIREMPGGCKAIKLYAGHVEEYWAFLTPQASKALSAYHNYRRRRGEILCDDSPIFATHYQELKCLGWNGARSVVYRAILKSNISRIKQKNRYDIQIDHGFRKRFNTILKLSNSVNYNIVEKLMGHKNGLDGVYLTPTLKELFVEFQKVIHKIEI